MIRSNWVSSKAVVAQDARVSTSILLERALEDSSFWDCLQSASAKVKSPETFSVVIKPDLSGYTAGSPAATNPLLVEVLIDALHDRGYSFVTVTVSRDSSSTFCENRDVVALADLLGYKFKTPKGREYQIADQVCDYRTRLARPGKLLTEADIIDHWREADFRIVFAKNKTDETEGYALCLESLFGLLVIPDKDYFYRHRMPGPEVLLEILELASPNFALVDGTTSLHGSGGTRSPNEHKSDTIIASEDVVLADYLGALKMGLDPSISRLFAKVTEETGLPHGYRLSGSIAPYQNWLNVHPLVIDSSRRRDRWVDVSRNVRPWLQEIDAELFPLREIIDSKCNEVAVPWFRNIDADPAGFVLLLAFNYFLDALGSSAYAYQVMYAKDTIRRVLVSLNVGSDTFGENSYASIPAELDELRLVLEGLSFSDGIRWRYLGEAIAFEAITTIPIGFEDFIAAVDITKTIQYMNDYLGGSTVVVETDNVGRPIRQIERNVYLPQPNYLCMYGADPIDVTKLEVAQYRDGEHRMYWKTIKSENSSARFDDGIVTFTRKPEGTHIAICGRQLFALPQIVQMARLELNPRLKASLVNEAYQRFFQRTFSNLEAVAEGRDVKMGREWCDPVIDPDGEPRLANWLEGYIRKYSDEFSSLFSTNTLLNSESAPSRMDESGFRHFRADTGASAKTHSPTLAALASNLTSIWADLFDASQKDIRWQLSRIESKT